MRREREERKNEREEERLGGIPDAPDGSRENEIEKSMRTAET